MSHPIFVIAHNIRSLHNVGSIFRSSECFGVSKIYLTGYTGQPPRAEIHKVALGAEDMVDWEFQENVSQLISQMKENGTKVIALETGDSAIKLQQIKVDQPIAVLLGSEVEGISDELLKLMDEIVEIPMCGQKSSLNVSVATGITLYALRQIVGR